MSCVKDPAVIGHDLTKLVKKVGGDIKKEVNSVMPFSTEMWLIILFVVVVVLSVCRCQKPARLSDVKTFFY